MVDAARAGLGDGYAALTPDRVLDLLAAVGLHGDGRLLQLNSYENRVFQVYLEDGDAVIVKVYRPQRWTDAQILEEHAFARELAEADVPVVPPRVLDVQPPGEAVRLSGSPPTLATDVATGYRFAVSARHAGRAPDLDDGDTLAWLGRFLGRLHAVGATRPFAHRLTLDVATYGEASRQSLLDGGFLPPTERPSWQATSDAALDLVRRAFERSGPLRRLRLHGDCHVGNVLWRDEGPHVVDLDDACNGPAVQDLWMLLPDGPEAALRRDRLIDGYRMFMPFDDRELQLVEPLRTLRMLHHSAWIARRWSDPAFPVAFPWFGTPAYWSQQTTQLREQIDAMTDAG